MKQTYQQAENTGPWNREFHQKTNTTAILDTNAGFFKGLDGFRSLLAKFLTGNAD
ncbi:MAG: hypothetical protein PHQ75_13020 [Thermoguttaceae bacterium]|nr:hypothetical protein [Thermoguttaceae bacterium]